MFNLIMVGGGKLLLCILIADLLTGAIHWFEDAYGNPNWKFGLGQVVKDNILHHEQPNKFLEVSFLERIKVSLFIAGILFSLFLLLGIMNWYIAFTLCYASLSNQIHAISHTHQTNKVILLLQKIGLIQSKWMHDLHHDAPYDCNYCVMTNYLNPILTYIDFWNRIERLLLKIGIKTTRGLNIREGF